jgi:heptosyltransferase II
MLKAVSLNPSAVSKLLVRATNWLGDAVMSLPAIRAMRHVFPQARIAVVARPSVADLYARESAIDRVIIYDSRTVREKLAFAVRLREERFECAILLQNAWDAALMAWLARIPVRIGYQRDGRGCLLTHAIPVPDPGDIPRHERFYYLALLRRAGLIERQYYADCGTAAIRLEGAEAASAEGLRQLAVLGVSSEVIGVSPGAAYGNAKRWLPERFAESAARLCFGRASAVLVFGAATERELCEEVAQRIRRGRPQPGRPDQPP